MTTWIARILFWLVSIAAIYITSFFLGALCGLIFEAWWKGYDLFRWMTF